MTDAELLLATQDAMLRLGLEEPSPDLFESVAQIDEVLAAAQRRGWVRLTGYGTADWTELGLSALRRNR